MPPRDRFREEVDRIKEKLGEMMEAERKAKRDPNLWLRVLYSSYLSQMLSDNDNIWKTGAIFVPLSLAGFAAFVSLETPTLLQTFVLMFASFGLMVSWLIVAENHRAFQQKCNAWLVAIQEIINITGLKNVKVRGNFLNRLLTFPAAVQIVRWALTVTLLIGWLIVLAAVAG